MKKYSFPLIALLIIFSVSACSSGGGNSSSGTKAPTATKAPASEAPKATEDANKKTGGEKVKLIYAHGKDDTSATKKIIEAFNVKHSDIQVEFREMPNNTGQQHDQYVTMFGAQSSEIDVLETDVIWPAEFAQAGYLLPLDRLIEQDKINLDDYIKGAVDSGYFNGQQWTMPKYIDTGHMFYRTDLMKEAPKTWDDLIAQAKALKGKGGTQFGYLMQAKQYEGLVCNFIEFIGSYGGRILDKDGKLVVNSPETIKGLKKMIEVVKSDYVPNNITTFTEPETHTAFIEGQSPLARNWSYQYALAQDPKQSKVVDKVSIGTMPAGDKGPAATLGGWLVAINKFSKHPKEAWELVKFITGSEGQKISAIDGGLAPSYLKLYDDAEVKKASPLFTNQNFIKDLSIAIPRPVSPVYPKISDIIQIEVSKALAGQQSAEDAVKNLESKIKEVIK